MKTLENTLKTLENKRKEVHLIFQLVLMISIVTTLLGIGGIIVDNKVVLENMLLIYGVLMGVIGIYGLVKSKKIQNS